MPRVYLLRVRDDAISAPLFILQRVMMYAYIECRSKHLHGSDSGIYEPDSIARPSHHAYSIQTEVN